MGVVAGLSVVPWAFGTWLIPVLLALGAWRHLLRRVPLAYEPGLWSNVFPVGMYGVAGRALGAALLRRQPGARRPADQPQAAGRPRVIPGCAGAAHMPSLGAGGHRRLGVTHSSVRVGGDDLNCRKATDVLPDLPVREDIAR